MIIKVKVKPNSFDDKIEKVEENEYVIYVTEPARNGRANIAVVRILARELGVDFRNIKIKNPSSRKKIVEIKSI